MDSETISRWAYLRQTEKVEDLAYCLLGLLGAFMYMGYGIGPEAWSRLERDLVNRRGGRASRLIKPKQLEDLERGEWDRVWNNGRPPDDDNKGGGGGGRGPPSGSGGQGPAGPGGAGGNVDDDDDSDSCDGGQGGEGGPVGQRQGNQPAPQPRYNGPRARLAGDVPDLGFGTSSMTGCIPNPGSYSMPSSSQTSTGYQMPSHRSPPPTGTSRRPNSNPTAFASSQAATASPLTPQMIRAAEEMAARSGISREDAMRRLILQYRQTSLAGPSQAGPSQAGPSQAGPSRPLQGASSSQASRTIQVGLNRLNPADAQQEREMQWSSRQMGRAMQQPNARARVTAASAEDSDYNMEDDSDEDSDGRNAAFA